MENPPWRQLRLSLERPYRDDNGEPIPTLLDIAPDGTHIYEPKHDPSKALGERLRQIFVERGADFFERDLVKQLMKEGSEVQQTSESPNPPTEPQHTPTHTMTSEELYKMRMEILPHLYIALGEMSHARDLLASLLPPKTPSQPLAPFPDPSTSSTGLSTLSATVVTKPPPITSVQAFNAQLVIGGKDQSLRKTADLFRAAVDTMERIHAKNEQYWLDALKIRSGNWGLIPAPLPPGSTSWKGADKTAKDFLVSFGLEESPAIFRRRAIAHMPTQDSGPDTLVFPQRQRVRLRVSVRGRGPDGTQVNIHNTIKRLEGDTLQGSLRAAQQEVVEQEIFFILVREAPNLLTAASRVSERLIIIEAALNLDLVFELVDSDTVEDTSPDEAKLTASWKCDLIYWSLHALLLRLHGHLKRQRLSTTGLVRAQSTQPSPPPPVLQPIIDFLQYEVFCGRVKVELERAVQGLKDGGVPSNLRFQVVGENGQQLVELLEDTRRKTVTGEAVLRIDNRHTLRLTLVSPSTLTVHLSSATLTVPSIPQLRQLLSSEIERCLLQRICELGSELCEKVKGTWFVDDVKGRSVGRWEGCVLNLKVICDENLALSASAFGVNHSSNRANPINYGYGPLDNISLLEWVQQTITKTIIA